MMNEVPLANTVAAGTHWADGVGREVGGRNGNVDFCISRGCDCPYERTCDGVVLVCHTW